MKKQLLLLSLLGMAFMAKAENVEPIYELKFNDAKKSLYLYTKDKAVKAEILNIEKSEYVNGRNGKKAIQLNNADKTKNNSAIIIKKPIINFQNPFTLSAWVKLADNINNTGPQYAIFSNQSGGNNGGLRLSYSWRTFRVIISGEKGEKPIILHVNNAKNQFNANAWNNVSLTYDGKTLKLYLNGLEVAQKDVKITPSKQPISIGAYRSGYAYGFNGIISNVKIFDVALNAKQVLDLIK